VGRIGQRPLVAGWASGGARHGAIVDSWARQAMKMGRRFASDEEYDGRTAGLRVSVRRCQAKTLSWFWLERATMTSGGVASFLRRCRGIECPFPSFPDDDGIQAMTLLGLRFCSPMRLKGLVVRRW
jgi:hypothetical protein